MSHAVVVPLDTVHARLVEELWTELDASFGVGAVRRVPFPHLTLQVARNYDPHALPGALREAAACPPFRVRTHGVGFFTGGHATGLALYLTVVRSPELSALHQAVWDALAGVTDGCEGMYDPTHWTPHVTIADRDLTPERLGAVVAWLAERPSHTWSMEVQELALIHDAGTARELRFRTPLG